MVEIINNDVVKKEEKDRKLLEVQKEVLGELQDILAELQSAKWDSGQGSGWLVAISD